jgi:hypothetical protein
VDRQTDRQNRHSHDNDGYVSPHDALLRSLTTRATTPRGV